MEDPIVGETTIGVSAVVQLRQLQVPPSSAATVHHSKNPNPSAATLAQSKFEGGESLAQSTGEVEWPELLFLISIC